MVDFLSDIHFEKRKIFYQFANRLVWIDYEAGRFIIRG
jgi:hypothetical protein